MLKINTRRLMGSGGFHLGATTKAKRNFTIVSVSSFVLFILVSFCILRPLYAIPDKYHTNAATGTSTASESSITLASTVTDTSVVLTPGAGFTLSSSTNTSSYDVITNNYTGYTITLTSEDNDKTLVHTVDNTKVISSINTPIAETDFVSTTSGLMNHFGIKPNKYYDTENNTTVDNTTSSTILPAPGTTGLILDKTTTANSTANNYSIALGAMVDGTIPAGDYTRDTILTVIPNPIYYTINYDKNTDDTVTNLPTSQFADTTETSITLSNVIPARTHYTFAGWCSVATTTANGVDSCAGTIYNPDGAGTNLAYGIDQTTTNTTTLHAMWRVDSFTVSVVPGANIATATGSGTFNYGDVITLTATSASSTACTSYSVPTWSSNVSGLSSTTGNSVTFTVTSDASIAVSSTGSSIPQTISLSRTDSATSIVIDGVGYAGSSVSLACGSHTISGTYSNGKFHDWTSSGNVSVTNNVAATTTLSVSGPGSLALNGITPIQSITNSTCSATPRLVYDVRDDEEYTIQKLADNRCWLLDNLRLDVVSTSLATLKGQTNASDLTLEYLKGTRLRNESSDPNGQYSTAAVSKTPVVRTYVPAINTDYSDTTGSGGYSAGKYGVYYNYCAASAGSYCYGSSSSNYSKADDDAIEDICPKGWRLPTGSNRYVDGGEFKDLATAYGNDRERTINALHAPSSGFITGANNAWNVSYQGERFYIPATTFFVSGAIGSYLSMEGLAITTTSLSPTSNVTLTNYNTIRCVLKPTSISELKYLQDFEFADKAAVLGSMSSGQSYQLKDRRDNEIYDIAKLADGKVWLQDNLRLDLVAKTFFVLASRTNAKDITLGHLTGGGGTDSDPYATSAVAYWGSTDSFTDPLIFATDKEKTGSGGYSAGKYGVYYNYCAASAGSHCAGTSSIDATEDICPSAWRMPTGGASGEFQALYTLYDSNTANYQSALHTPFSGSVHYGAVSNQGTIGLFWSSTGLALNTMNMMTTSASSTRPQGRSNTDYGNSVRCVLK